LASHANEKDLTDKALRKLNAGRDPSEVLQQLASTLTNRFLHTPSMRLREAAENQDYEILKAADWIFKPDDAEEDQ
jgi:glutamyl-tRNA reductase